jgi:hypothetical protein
MALFSDVFGTGSYDAAAARAKAAAVKGADAKSKKQLEATKKGYSKAREALAPALTNIGDIYAQEQTGRNAYLSALGLGDPSIAKDAYGNFLQPVNEYGIQDLERYGANTGTLASGGTQKDLYDYGYTTRFAPWLQALSGFNPLAANAQNIGARTTLGGWDIGQGTDVSNIFGSKYDALTGAKVGYQNQLAANRSQAAGNQMQLAQTLINAAAQGAGMAFGGPAGAAGAGAATKALPQYAAVSNPNATFPGWGMG